jgi:hypothetical protein
VGEWGEAFKKFSWAINAIILKEQGKLYPELVKLTGIKLRRNKV